MSSPPFLPLILSRLCVVLKRWVFHASFSQISARDNKSRTRENASWPAEVPSPLAATFYLINSDTISIVGLEDKMALENTDR